MGPGLIQYQKAKDLMEAYDDLLRFVGPRDPALIDKAEQALGLKFPEDYRQFLLDYGTGTFGACEFNGILDGDFSASGPQSGIGETLELRQKFHLPRKLIYVQSGGGIGYDYFLMVGDEDEPSPIISFSVGWSWEEQGLHVIAQNFGSFFMEGIKQAIIFAESNKLP